MWAGLARGSLVCGCGSLRMQRCCRLCRCALSSSSCFFLASSWVTMHRSHKPARSLGTGEAMLRQTLWILLPHCTRMCPAFPNCVHGPPGLPPAEGLAAPCNYVWKGSSLKVLQSPAVETSVWFGLCYSRPGRLWEEPFLTCSPTPSGSPSAPSAAPGAGDSWQRAPLLSVHLCVANS